MDGWGLGKVINSDAIQHAKTPFVSSLYARYANTTLVTCGEDVGLPIGQMGNSEVGHLNLGAGRIVYQELQRINVAIKTGEFAKNEQLLKAIGYAKENTWYLTDEYFSTLGLGGNLYEMKLESLTDVDDNDVIEFDIQPNPASEFLKILFPDNKEEREIKIYDYMGKLCMNYSINQLRNTIPMRDLANGIYIVKTISKNWRKTFSKKIIVIK